MYYAIFTLLGFLSGSMMYSQIIPYFFTGRDIAALSDDKNPGSGNVFLHSGIFLGILCLLLDVLKGTVPVALSLKYCSILHPLFAFVLAAPALGHACTFCLARFLAPAKFCWMVHTSGKAIAVSFGCLIGIMSRSMAVLALAAPFIFFSAIVRVNPHGARVILSFGCFLLTSVTRHYPPALFWGCVFLSFTVILKHLAAFQEARNEFRIEIGFHIKHREK